MTAVRVAVLVSGTGSILDAMLADDVPVSLVLAGDTVESLHERIKQCERQLYPRVLKQYIASRTDAAPSAS